MYASPLSPYLQTIDENSLNRMIFFMKILGHHCQHNPRRMMTVVEVVARKQRKRKRTIKKKRVKKKPVKKKPVKKIVIKKKESLISKIIKLQNSLKNIVIKYCRKNSMYFFESYSKSYF